MSFKSDMGKLGILERRMSRTGDIYIRLEKMSENLTPGPKLRAIFDRMILIEAEQDEINSKLHDILKKYKVYYHKTYYLVEDPDGGEYHRQEDPNDSAVA